MAPGDKWHDKWTKKHTKKKLQAAVAYSQHGYIVLYKETMYVAGAYHDPVT